MIIYFVDHKKVMKVNFYMLYKTNILKEEKFPFEIKDLLTNSISPCF